MGMKENAHGMNFEPYPVSTRRPVDGPSRFPKGPNVRNLQGTFRGLSMDRYKS